MKLFKIILSVFILIISLAFLNSATAGSKRAKEVAKDVYAITDLGFSNCGFIVTKDGVVVVDTSLAPFMAAELVKAIKEVTDQPVKYVINTHWHGDHVGGNEVFVPQAHIIAHEYTKKIIEQRKKEQDEGKIDEQMKSMGVKFTVPDISFDKEKTLNIGDKTIELKFLGGGHTKGDIVVYLPKEKVLFSGDLFIKGSGLPDYREDSSVDSLIESMKKIQELDIDKIVCGHLYVADKKDLKESIDKVIAFRAEVKKYVDQNIAPEKVAETMKFPEGENPYYKQHFKEIIIKTYNDVKNSSSAGK